MEPKIVEKSAFKVVGLQTYATAMSHDFARMWSLLMDGDLTVPNHVGEHIAYGICSYIEAPCPTGDSLPDDLAELTSRLIRTVATQVQLLGRQPTIEELAAELGVSKETAELLLKKMPASFSLEEESAEPVDDVGNFSLFYMAAVEVDSFDNLPVNLVAKAIPANTYAVFIHHGVLDSRLKDTFQAAYQWLAASDYERAGPYDMEFYGPQFSGPQNPDSVLEIWVPVRKGK